MSRTGGGAHYVNGFTNLTTLWTSAGSKPEQAPERWLAKADTKQLVIACFKSGVTEAKSPGDLIARKADGMWAEGVRATVYAESLCPRFMFFMMQKHRTLGMQIQRGLAEHLRELTGPNEFSDLLDAAAKPDLHVVHDGKTK